MTIINCPAISSGKNCSAHPRRYLSLSGHCHPQHRQRRLLNPRSHNRHNADLPRFSPAAITFTRRRGDRYWQEHDPVQPTEHRLSAWLPVLREILAREKRFRWQLLGSSMAPTLPPGCEVEIVPLSTPVRRGDLVVFVADDAVVVHRAVGCWRGGWITQGDGRRTPDPPLEPDLVLGVVRAAHRGGRRCWPGPLSRYSSMVWVVRYHCWRVVRASLRVIGRLRR